MMSESSTFSPVSPVGFRNMKIKNWNVKSLIYINCSKDLKSI